MATSAVEEIERKFAQLDTQLQLALLERLAHSVASDSQKNAEFERELAVMARDAHVQREIKQIDQEFRATENDGIAGD